jgi:hypothetical protein
MFYLVLIIVIEQNRDNIKAGRFVMLMVSGKPGECGLTDLPLFEWSYRKLRDSVGESFPAFDLYEDKGIAILCDDIDFAPLAAEVSFDYSETVSFQKCCCQLFSAISECCILLTFAIFPSHANT